MVKILIADLIDVKSEFGRTPLILAIANHGKLAAKPFEIL